jgi:hypothetical protein
MTVPGIRRIMEAGVYISNCIGIVIANAHICDNSGRYRGGALYLTASDVTITNAVITNNVIQNYANRDAYGGGIFAGSDSHVNLNNSSILKNNGHSPYRGDNHYGVGICVYSGSTLNAKYSVVKYNYAPKMFGGELTIGGIYIDSGGVFSATNCLIAQNYSNNDNGGDGIYSEGTLHLSGCTIVSNHTAGIEYVGGSVSLANCIIYNNTDDLVNFPTNQAGVLSNVYYSCIGNGDNMGINGCISTNPVFVDTNYYHLQSVRGNYTNGYFSGGGWGESESNSPCVDAGNPDSAFEFEPSPNGNRINMGAYGNTPKASLSKSSPYMIKMY